MIRLLALSLLVGTAVSASPQNPTYHKDVLPVIQKNCQGCHRPGEAAPMSFLDYKATRPWAKAIKSAVVRTKMPPWQADPSASHKFSNDLSLTDDERSVLVKWADQGAPEGNAKDAPKPLAFVEGWNISKPDSEYVMPQAFTVPATGTIEYQYIVVPTNLTEDKWVQMAEVRPGARPVVHHVIVYIRPKGSKWLAEAQPGVPFVPQRAKNRTASDSNGAVDPQENAGLMLQSELLVGFAPGMPAQILEPGVAKLLPAGADLVMQMHYTSTGKEMTDQTRIGVVFAKAPPVRRDITLAAANNRFAIPAGDANYEVRSQMTLPGNVTLINLMPHMHLRGKDFSYKLVYPNGETSQLLTIPKYDFNWQLVYTFAKPLELPAGSRIECVAHFDNSPNNPYNPDPRATVRFGDQTWDEMMIGWFDITVPAGADLRSLFWAKRTAGAD